MKLRIGKRDEKILLQVEKIPKVQNRLNLI